MKIYIDADGCPVVDITVRLAKKYHVGCVILCDTCHRIEREGAETIVVEKGGSGSTLANIAAEILEYYFSAGSGMETVTTENTLLR